MKKNTKSLTIIIVTLLLVAVIGASSAYFMAQLGEGANINVSAKTDSVDSLMFENTGTITINADQTNFGETNGSLNGNARVKAILKPNSTTGRAKKTYNIFLIIQSNGFSYTQGENQPELLLKLTDPTNAEYTTIVEDLKYYENVPDRNSKTYSGYDITNKHNIVYKMVSDYPIEATSNEQKVQEWQVEVDLINYEANQNDNTGKSFNGLIYITAEDDIKLSEVNTLDITTSESSITANVHAIAGTTAIDKYYFGIEEVDDTLAMTKTNIKKIANIKLENFAEETKPSHEFNEGINEGHSYKIYSYAVDKNGFMSNVYENVVTIGNGVVPKVSKVEITPDDYNIMVSVLADNATKYYYKINDGEWIGPKTNTYTFNNLKSNTNYSITIKVESEEGQTNTYSIEKVTTTSPKLSDYIITNASKNELIQHTGKGAEDGNYRYTGGDYQVTEKYTEQYKTIYDIISIKLNDNTIHKNNYWWNSDRKFYLTYQEDQTSTSLKTLLTKAINDGYVQAKDINNYICFGSSASICPKDNLYRIIGVYETSSGKQVKLVKAGEANKEQLGEDGSFYDYYDHDVTYIGDDVYNKDVYYWDKEEASKQAAWADSSLNTVNLNINFVKYLTDLEDGKWIDKIADTDWQVGGMTPQNGFNSNAKTAYDYELGNNKNSLTENKKIGLMYVSDYYYAASEKYWTLTGYDGRYPDVTIETSIDYRGAIWDNWLWDGDSEWLITPSTDYTTGGAFYVNHYGIVPAGALQQHAIRPCFYLESEVTYARGSGTATDPYRIN